MDDNEREAHLDEFRRGIAKGLEAMDPERRVFIFRVLTRDPVALAEVEERRKKIRAFEESIGWE